MFAQNATNHLLLSSTSGPRPPNAPIDVQRPRSPFGKLPCMEGFTITKLSVGQRRRPKPRGFPVVG